MVQGPTGGDGEAAIELAERLLRRAGELQTPHERRQQAELDRMIANPDDKATMVEMTDQAFRTRTPWRVADQLTHILDLQGIPRFFNPLDHTLLRGFQSFGSYLPGVAVPMVKEKMRRETANVILPAEALSLRQHLRDRAHEGIRMNINYLGEAILGEDEADRRLRKYLTALANPDITCISVKVSTIYSQITPLSYRHCVEVLSERLARLLREAVAQSQAVGPAGSSGSPDSGMSAVPKFVYLDMEEYRDMRLTAEVLMRVLDLPGLEQARAGIALQAYLPDSDLVLQGLIEWAGRRTARGGSPLTVRVVKGANLEMERVEAAIAGFPQAPYDDKLDTDANYKRMLRRLIDPEVAKSVRVGVASHNLFDIALALHWARQAGVADSVQFEMLEGMANHQRRALVEASPSMLLYAPVCSREDFLNAIGYLIRRLDENTGPANFLRHAYRLVPDSPTWKRLADDFREACKRVPTVSSAPRRTQDRDLEPCQPPDADHWRNYTNEPDTDWALSHNVRWAEGLVEDWRQRCDDRATIADLPLLAGRGPDRRLTGKSYDPSRPGVVVSHFFEGSADDVDAAVRLAVDDPTGWRGLDFEKRSQCLREAAQNMRRRRRDLIGAAVTEGGKMVSEADAEVSEAIDFAEFYRLSVRRFHDLIDTSGCGLVARGRGTIVVVSPWNFPIAIPCGGVAAALAAGNTVILKPSSDTPMVAHAICRCFWDAGVPPAALQWLPTVDVPTSQRLVSHPEVDTVILTGGTQTGRAILQSRHGIELLAETGGKNATIVTALADRDLAIKHVIQSAFGHAGQKCSATSLLLLEQEIYDDADFRQTLADAVRSLRVGTPWDLSTRVGPLIRPPAGPLRRAIDRLEPGESWLVEPRVVDGNPRLISPGVKWGVRPGSFTHMTELFGPILDVMPFRNLGEAIGIVNATGYGLTSGLQSLDDREQEQWVESVRAGNLYINRGTTGAIVLRQPFGGMGASALGPGVKAGGPHYVVPLMRFTETLPECPADGELILPEPLDELIVAVGRMADEGRFDLRDLSRLTIAIGSIASAAEEEFNTEHDTAKLLGQDNRRRYLAVPHLRVRLQPEDSVTDILIAAAAAVAVECRVAFSHRDGDCEEALAILAEATESWAGRIEIIEESDDELVAAILGHQVDRLRILSDRVEPPSVSEACIERFVPCIRRPVVASGWVELLWYLQEQSVSHDYHRYGNLGRRATEPRRALVGALHGRNQG